LGQIVLARLLLPHDFGSIGLTFTVTTIIGALTASGIGDVLLQRRRTFRLWAWPAFLIDIALALAGAALVLALAPTAGRLYAAPEITGLASVLALAMPLSALSMIPLTAIRASLDFRLLATVGTAEALAIQCLSILFAWCGMGAYSFALPLPVVAAFKALLLWAIVQPRLHPRRPRRRWLYLARSGFWNWGFRLLLGLISQGDYFVLGLLGSRPEVGLYFFAFRLSAQPLQALADNLSNVMFPVLVRLRSQSEEQCRAALKASQVLAAAVLFTGALQAALASPVLHLLFQDRWAGSIRLSQILSIGLSFDAVCWIAGALVNARGEFRRNFIFVLFSAPCFFSLVALGGWLGHAFGVATGVALYYAIVGPSYSYFALRSAVSAGGVLRLYLLPLILAGVAVVVAYTSTCFLIESNLPEIQIVLITALAIMFYAILLRIFMPDTFFPTRK
jgi:PST family polysaccharide transporter